MFESNELVSSKTGFISKEVQRGCIPVKIVSSFVQKFFLTKIHAVTDRHRSSSENLGESLKAQQSSGDITNVHLASFKLGFARISVLLFVPLRNISAVFTIKIASGFSGFCSGLVLGLLLESNPVLLFYIRFAWNRLTALTDRALLPQILFITGNALAKDLDDLKAKLLVY
uniref:Uncharacterized protein n=1 Tax=Glossina palpalis gambiensis TaxID=67801 RepID=A0A1B0AS19_9MUSC